MTRSTVELSGDGLTLDDAERILHGSVERLTLAPAARKRVEKARRALESLMATGEKCHRLPERRVRLRTADGPVGRCCLGEVRVPLKVPLEQVVEPAVVDEPHRLVGEEKGALLRTKLQGIEAVTIVPDDQQTHRVKQG